MNIAIYKSTFLHIFYLTHTSNYDRIKIEIVINLLIKGVVHMGTEILTKTLAPTLTLTALETSLLPSIFQKIQQFPEQSDINNTDSFICETCQFPFNENSAFQIYCVLPRFNRRADYDNYPATVLQRRNVVTKVVQHSLENCNFDEEFQALLQYINDQQLTSVNKYRIIFHKEKRKWKRKSFFKKPDKPLITELQIEVEP